MVLLVSHQACAIDEHITYTTNEDRKKKEKETKKGDEKGGRRETTVSQSKGSRLTPRTATFIRSVSHDAACKRKFSRTTACSSK